MALPCYLTPYTFWYKTMSFDFTSYTYRPSNFIEDVKMASSACLQDLSIKSFEVPGAKDL